MTDSERRREQARRDGIQKLESIFRAMERPARELVRLVGIYQNCTSGKLNRGCDSQLPPIGLKAIEVGRHMDEAQTVARTSYITPGELRDVRDRLGLDHRIWDLTVRLAAKYRNVR